MSPEMGRPFDPGFRARTAAHPGSRGWKPLEIGAMAAGFVVFWPVGLAVVGFKVWQKQSGYPGDLFTFVREKWDSVSSFTWSSYGSSGSAPRGWNGAGSSGNAAFDDWRQGELSRLEEERRKLVAAEREFADFLEQLRRARDRDEFDRFMQERRGRQGTTSI